MKIKIDDEVIFDGSVYKLAGLIVLLTLVYKIGYHLPDWIDALISKL